MSSQVKSPIKFHALYSECKILWATKIKIDFKIGTNNQFHINSKSELALLYNDRSVLENHHISAAFRLMRDPERNIVQNLDDCQYRDFRSNVIGKLKLLKKRLLVNLT